MYMQSQRLEAFRKRKKLKLKWSRQIDQRKRWQEKIAVKTLLQSRSKLSNSTVYQAIQSMRTAVPSWVLFRSQILSKTKMQQSSRISSRCTRNLSRKQNLLLWRSVRQLIRVSRSKPMSKRIISKSISTLCKDFSRSMATIKTLRRQVKMGRSI